MRRSFPNKRASRILDSVAAATFIDDYLLPELCDRKPKYGHLLRTRTGLKGGSIDSRATARYLRQLGLFSAGRGSLDTGALGKLNSVFGSTFGSIHKPENMRTLLEEVGYVQHGDNIHRLLSRAELKLPKTIDAYAAKHLDPTDPFDSLRSCTSSNIYAIDSVTTSEVDDAIGLEVLPDGREQVIVYVADATAFVPFDSELEALSGRRSGTTVYLPEGVFFMLPKSIVSAATLEANRRCRTFEIRFEVDRAGAVSNYDVGVGFTSHLKRLSYEQAQSILDAPTQAPPSDAPSWFNAADSDKMRRLRAIASRLQSAAVGTTVNLPEPYIRADPESKVVTALHDQVSHCADAYAFVASFMIAANEVCSRVAQANGLPIPFRGSRPLATTHEAAKQFVAPVGMFPHRMSERPTSASGRFASSVLEGLDSLRGVTRALYHHKPLWHNGLGTRNYCHSTSPLRRYPDMLVHHQLKSWIARRAGHSLLVPIEEFQMAELCQGCSETQLDASLMQTYSQRYWTLKHLADTQRSRPEALLVIVGFTHDISACPDTPRSLTRRFRFRSDVFIPSLHTMDVVYHNDSEARIGSAFRCSIAELKPTCNRLVLEHLRTEESRDDLVERLSKAVTTGD